MFIHTCKTRENGTCRFLASLVGEYPPQAPKHIRKTGWQRTFGAYTQDDYLSSCSGRFALVKASCGARREQLPRLFPRVAVRRVSLFFSCKQLAVFHIERLFRRELLQPKLVERTLCRAVPVDLLLMLVQELFRVTGGFVLLKNLPRAGIIENVPPQYVDLRQPLLRRVHLVQKLAAMRRCFVRFLRQHIV